MAKFALPYGREKIECEIPDARLSAVLESGMHGYDPGASGQELVARAMENPIGSEPLGGLARGKRNVVVIISDHTRPVPSKVILPLMLAQIRAGNPYAQITLLVAEGFIEPHFFA